MNLPILNYKKTKLIDLGDICENEKEIDHIIKVTKLQQYNPLYSVFFHLSQSNYDTIQFNNTHQIVNLHEIINTTTHITKKADIFIKYSPLLDPIRYMIGKYDISNNKIRNLPTLLSNNENCDKKLLEYNNASYVDNFFNYLSSVLLNNYHFSNGIDYYGSFLGIQEKFRMNIEDDLEYLSESSFFLQNIGKLMTIDNFDKDSLTKNSRCNKSILILEENVELTSLDMEDLNLFNKEEENTSMVISIKEIDLSSIKTNDIDITKIHSSTFSSTSNSHSSTSTSTSTSTSSHSSCSSNTTLTSKDNKEEDEEDNDIKEGSSEEDNSEDDSSEDDSNEDDNNDAIAYIYDFPVQLICLERCEGTMDDLFTNNIIDNKNGIAFLFQIVMTLVVYQKVYQFTHNDLHTNNIMFQLTTKKYLYYEHNNISYKVPTYGYLFKIIDFGRSIYKYKGNIFCSDSFAIDGDGNTQYNCEPFYDESKKKIEPNFSFDLCRLGCSIYDIILDKPPLNIKNLHSFQKIIIEWVTDDNGRNVVYKKNGSERYPGFKLYKMISRTVHKNIPEDQLKKSCFQKFKIDKKHIPLREKIINIDLFPICS